MRLKTTPQLVLIDDAATYQLIQKGLENGLFKCTKLLRLMAKADQVVLTYLKRG
jgi:hypothetical protein